MKLKNLKVLVFACIFAFTVASAFGQENPNERERGTPRAVEVPDPGAGVIVKIVHIPASAFVVDGYDPTGYYFTFAGGYLYGVSASSCCMSAPIVLPEGASVIKSIKIVAWDGNAGASEWFDVYRMNLVSGYNNYLGTASTSDTGGPSIYTIFLNEPVSNKVAFCICTCLRPNIYVYGAAVIFE